MHLTPTLFGFALGYLPRDEAFGLFALLSDAFECGDPLIVFGHWFGSRYARSPPDRVRIYDGLSDNDLNVRLQGGLRI